MFASNFPVDRLFGSMFGLVEGVCRDCGRCERRGERGALQAAMREERIYRI